MVYEACVIDFSTYRYHDLHIKLRKSQNWHNLRTACMQHYASVTQQNLQKQQGGMTGQQGRAYGAGQCMLGYSTAAASSYFLYTRPWECLIAGPVNNGIQHYPVTAHSEAMGRRQPCNEAID